jgi:hypothetical protein
MPSELVSSVSESITSQESLYACSIFPPILWYTHGTLRRRSDTIVELSVLQIVKHMTGTSDYATSCFTFIRTIIDDQFQGFHELFKGSPVAPVN